MNELKKLLTKMSALEQTTYTMPSSRDAMRSGLRDAVTLCAAMKANIEAANPGRRTGSVSSVGVELADVAKRLGDLIWEMRETIEVPAPAGGMSLTSRLRDALQELARWEARQRQRVRPKPYRWRTASMRRLAEAGLVEQDPNATGAAWALSDAGRAWVRRQ